MGRITIGYNFAHFDDNTPGPSPYDLPDRKGIFMEFWGTAASAYEKFARTGNISYLYQMDGFVLAVLTAYFTVLAVLSFSRIRLSTPVIESARISKQEIKNIRELNEIGNNVSVGTLSVTEHHVRVGDNVRIHTQAFIPELTILEDNVWIGPNVVLTNAKYPLSPNVKEELKGAILKKGAKIGANATILPGIVIGQNALVGAGSVVVKDVPDNAVVVGNPARIIKHVDSLPY